MNSFPKFQKIPPMVLEKCEVKSYFRLQQTCRDIQEFIENSNNICIHFETEKDAPCYQRGLFYHLYYLPGKTVCLDGLYGVRLRNISLSRQFYTNHDGLAQFLEFMEKNRIRCHHLRACIIGWTIEQFTKLLQCVKPSKMGIHTGSGGGYSSHYDIILKAKQVREVYLILGPGDFLLVARQFMTTFPVVRIHVLGPEHVDIEVRLIYCDAVLQILHTERPQNLRDFYFSNIFRSRFPTAKEMEEQLFNYNPRVEENTEPRYSIFAWTDLPDSLPSNSFCKIRFGYNVNDSDTLATINYGRRGPDKQPTTKFPFHLH